jgi:hypothetical protein
MTPYDLRIPRRPEDWRFLCRHGAIAANRCEQVFAGFSIGAGGEDFARGVKRTSEKVNHNAHPLERTFVKKKRAAAMANDIEALLSELAELKWVRRMS